MIFERIVVVFICFLPTQEHEPNELRETNVIKLCRCSGKRWVEKLWATYFPSAREREEKSHILSWDVRTLAGRNFIRITQSATFNFILQVDVCLYFSPRWRNMTMKLKKCRWVGWVRNLLTWFLFVITWWMNVILCRHVSLKAWLLRTFLVMTAVLYRSSSVFMNCSDVGWKTKNSPCHDYVPQSFLRANLIDATLQQITRWYLFYLNV
jgi:hypothetical protein